MPDKKVEKSSAARPLSPSQRLEASRGSGGTINMADPGHDKAKSALVDKFRAREERYRREQSLHDQQAEHPEHERGEEMIQEAEDLAEDAPPTAGTTRPKVGRSPEPSENTEGGAS